MFVFKSPYFKFPAFFGWWPENLEEVMRLLEETPIVILGQCPETLGRDLARWVFRVQPFHTPLIDLKRSEEQPS